MWIGARRPARSACSPARREDPVEVDHTLAAIAEAGAEERAAFDDLESAFSRVRDALADADAARLAKLLVAVEAARTKWIAAGRNKTELTNRFSQRLVVAVSTMTARRSGSAGRR